MMTRSPGAGTDPEYGAAPPLTEGTSPDAAVSTSAQPRVQGSPREQLEYRAAVPVHDVYAPPPVPSPRVGPPPMPVMQPGYAPMHAQAVGRIEHEQAHTLGLSFLAVAAGIAAGAYYGGLPGAAAGSLFGGTAVNALRAFSYFKEGTDEGDKEGRISATYGVVAAAGGGLLWWRYVHGGERYVANPPDEVDFDTARDTPCGIRPVGP